VKGARAKALTDYEEEPKGPRANALVLSCVIWMMRDIPNPIERQRFSKGVQPKDVKDFFPTFMKLKHDKRVSFAKYHNKLRAGVHGYKDEEGNLREETVTMGRHKIWMEDMKDYRVHFFPLRLHEEGLVNHSNCENCEVPVVE